MWLNELRQRWLGRPRTGRKHRQLLQRPRDRQLGVEALEHRTLLSVNPIYLAQIYRPTPQSALVEDGSANLFGASDLGGANYASGSIYELPAGSHATTTFASFGAGTPQGIVADGNGNLFGTVQGGYYGADAAFEISTTSGLSIPAQFSYATRTQGTPVVDANGNLFGTTYLASGDAGGTVYEIPNTVFEQPNGGAVNTLASFDASSGTPNASIVVDSQGDVFGTTPNGGQYGQGSVFEVVANGDGSYTLQTLVSFSTSSSAGGVPVGGLIADGSGNLYGATTAGGQNGYGTVFETAEGGNSVTVLANNLETPTTTLTLDSSGDLYGSALNGLDPPINNPSGQFSYIEDASVFAVAAGSGTYTQIAGIWAVAHNAYTYGVGGYDQPSILTVDNSGNIFGTRRI